MNGKYLKLGLVGSIIGALNAYQANIWSMSLNHFNDVLRFFLDSPYLFYFASRSWSFFEFLIRILSYILPSILNTLPFLVTVIIFGIFMICFIMLGVGFYGTRSLNNHKMTVVSLIAGVGLSPLVFIFMFLSTYPPTSSWLLNIFDYWALAFSPNGFLFLLVQVLFTTILSIFALTLIVTRRTTGKSKTALAAGIIIIIWGIAYITVLVTINLYSPPIFPLLMAPFLMITAVFKSAQKMAAGVKPKVKGVEKPPVAKLPEKIEEEETKKVVICPFCGAPVSKKELKCPECGGVLI